MVKDGQMRGLLGRIMLHAAVFSVFINVLMLTTPLYLMQIYDRVLASFSIDTLVYLSVIAVAALCFLGLMEVVRSLYFQRMATTFDREHGPEAFRIALRSSASGSVDAQPMRDLAAVRNFIGARGLGAVFDLPFVPLFVFVLYFVHPVLFWLTVAGIGVLLVFAVLNQLGIRGSSALAAERSATANAHALAFAGNAETIRAMGMQRGVTEAWGAVFAQAAQAGDRASAINAAFGGASRTLRMMLQLAILGVGAWLVLHQEMTAGMIFASAIISGRALQPIDQLIGGWRSTIDAARAWSRLSAMMARSRREAPRERTRLPDLRGRIEVRDLTYVPPATGPTEAIIRKVSFTVEPGQSVAIIGPSRAGKSTLARLLVGALSPTSGEVRIDGTDLRNWDEAQLGSGIGYLAQDVQLIAGTIAQNIGRFDPDATDDAVTSAATRAEAHELIKSLREAYETRISPVGSTLSGGEKQRIGLARAFYGNPRILVLDEPNANLDTEGEAALERAVANARATGTTVIVVTHRLQMAAACDRVLELRKGAIEAYGPSREILRNLQRNRGAVVPMRRGQGPVSTLPVGEEEGDRLAE